MVTTAGHLLGGRVKYCQSASGFRTGIEPVLLAASVPARAGDYVLEAGTGAGAALLCLSERLAGIHAVGVEVDQTAAGLATANASSNRRTNIEIITGPIEAVTLRRSFDHAIANPPYHAPSGSVSPVAVRDTAKRGSAELLLTWIRRLSAALRNRGSLTLIVPAGSMPTCLAAMAASRCPCTIVYPLWPKAGRPAKLVLLRGLRNARTSMQLTPGLVLHNPDGSFTEAAQRIFAEGAALDLDRAMHPGLVQNG